MCEEVRCPFVPLRFKTDIGIAPRFQFVARMANGRECGGYERQVIPKSSLSYSREHPPWSKGFSLEPVADKVQQTARLHRFLRSRRGSTTIPCSVVGGGRYYSRLQSNDFY